MAAAAIDKINAIANPQLPKIGERFLGTVVKTTAFGAFVSLLPGRDGLVHISKLGNGKRIAKVEDVANVGDKHTFTQFRQGSLAESRYPCCVPTS